jgi:predicted RNA-binding protein (virulence factor B family)
MEIGKYNEMEVLRDTSSGLFLGDDKGLDVLLPGKYIPPGTQVGDTLRVFIYRDSEDRPVATTEEPKILLHQFALLKAVMVNEFGAFLDWGLEKHLFVPYREQLLKMVEERFYLVYMYLDEQTDRLVASAKLNRFLNNDDLDLRTGDEVDLIVWTQTDLGMNVIVNNRYKGLLYANELFAQIRPGDRMKGYVKNIREDNKMDITLQKQGFENIEPNAARILDILKSNGGFLGLNDNSSPNEIASQLEISKKTFKKAIGTLYRKKLIVLEEAGIRLAEKAD